ncbi:vanillate O-demethylase monooxygenase subunit [Novosphingobium chloroacetimidivorans]|uniref:Vanillate O-demethylase monooxygenase subunit n=1 Tax=Novosphingobium chloroacetimidivorans TaxID=1428314 RepID=A0A7W7K9H5_9SPHN|nr:Rieske 2Fe-2S domain-containing protein [Novosphingobium chloroacetimidivorans]MBB4858685.1 vanillate O-demethylase monooxygenase subunit [Novosphingobium chloroacetimidivorans]
MERVTRTGRGTQTFVIPELPIAERSDDAPPQDCIAPLIYNAWYVIALSEEVDRTLRVIKVLNQPLVYYRTEAGEPIVLDDRCSHRRYPLSKGRLKGDTIQCGYHGFTYEKSGQCIWAPGMPVNPGNQTKLPFGVRSYPAVEKGPWLWVWMGEPALANPADIPLPELLDRPDATICGYKMNPCNYMMIIENLLDLSHLHFVHDAVDLDHVSTPPSEVPAPDNAVGWSKIVESTEVALAANLCGGDPKRLARQQDGAFQYGPSLCYGYQRREPLAGDNEPIKPELMEIVHAMTPVDERNTHQFFTMVMSDPFVIDKAEVQHIIQDIVFEQDVDVVRDIQTYVDEETRTGRLEFNMIYDRFGVKMRKILDDMKKRELAEA